MSFGLVVIKELQMFLKWMLESGTCMLRLAYYPLACYADWGKIQQDATLGLVEQLQLYAIYSLQSATSWLRQSVNYWSDGGFLRPCGRNSPGSSPLHMYQICFTANPSPF